MMNQTQKVYVTQGEGLKNNFDETQNFKKPSPLYQS